MRGNSFLLCILCTAISACGSGGIGSIGSIDIPEPVQEVYQLDTPRSSNPPPNSGAPDLDAQTFDLANVGYEEVEFFLEGTANSYINISGALEDGLWFVQQADLAAYKTRIVVHRPIDPTSARGRTVIEWMNAEQGGDTPLCWRNSHVEIYRSGAVWVGVTAQTDGISRLNRVNPVRYDSLSHPGDSFSYDIFAQVTAALRSPDGVDPMGGRPTGTIVACGHSEAADRLVTFTNGVEQAYQSSGYDGILIISRSEKPSAISQPPQDFRDTRAGTLIREDNRLPVLTVQSETDVINRGSAEARQPDSNSFRLWEIAGSANLDYYSIDNGRGDASGDPMFAAQVEVSRIGDDIECEQAVNTGPTHYVLNQGLRAVVDWSASGSPASAASRLELDEQGDLVLDVNNNAIGGLRTPFSDAPAATLSGLGNGSSGTCARLGTTALFAADYMASLYVEQAGYVEAVSNAADAAVASGHLTREDADAIVAWAPSQWEFQVGL